MRFRRKGITPLLLNSLEKMVPSESRRALTLLEGCGGVSNPLISRYMRPHLYDKRGAPDGPGHSAQDLTIKAFCASDIK